MESPAPEAGEARWSVVQRKEVPVDDQHTITVVTEQMKDGEWIASVKSRSPMGEKPTDTPVLATRYAPLGEAEEVGTAQAHAWIERNMPRAA